MRKASGMASNNPKPKPMKTVRKPDAGVELKWRTMVISEMPHTPPTDRNIPRSPVIVATFSGINSMHALLAVGNVIPIPIPDKSSRTGFAQEG